MTMRRRTTTKPTTTKRDDDEERRALRECRTLVPCRRAAERAKLYFSHHVIIAIAPPLPCKGAARAATALAASFASLPPAAGAPTRSMRSINCWSTMRALMPVSIPSMAKTASAASAPSWPK